MQQTTLSCIVYFTSINKFNKSKFNQRLFSINYMQLFNYTIYVPKYIKFKQQKNSFVETHLVLSTLLNKTSYI